MRYYFAIQATFVGLVLQLVLAAVNNVHVSLPPTEKSAQKTSQDRVQKEQLYEAYNLLHTLAQVVIHISPYL
jgi:hypothetical protein